tara:strand:+ start:122 stop:319 length:198 start_codon:yes stop_codon:yes gene_type:complete
MKILMILGTGVILTFPMDKSVIPDCFSQGHAILEKLATYHGPGPTQGWILKNARIPIEVAGWYCR